MCVRERKTACALEGVCVRVCGVRDIACECVGGCLCVREQESDKQHMQFRTQPN